MSTTTTTTDRKQNLDQRRAADAWEKMNSIAHHPDKKRCEDYTGEAHKLPVRIMASGLGQALAFLFAKQKKKPGLVQLLQDLSRWVLVKRIEGSAIEVPAQKEPDLLQAILASNTDFLRWATDETLAYLQWINRFAEGLGHNPSTDNNE